MSEINVYAANVSDLTASDNASDDASYSSDAQNKPSLEVVRNTKDDRIVT